VLRILFQHSALNRDVSRRRHRTSNLYSVHCVRNLWNWTASWWRGAVTSRGAATAVLRFNAIYEAHATRLNHSWLQSVTFTFRSRSKPAIFNLHQHRADDAITGDGEPGSGRWPLTVTEQQGYQHSVLRYWRTEGTTENIPKSYRNRRLFGMHCVVVNTLLQYSVRYTCPRGRREGICGNTRTPPRIRNLSTRWKSVSSFTTGRCTPGSH
jgi:hypothetical protein